MINHAISIMKIFTITTMIVLIVFWG